MRARHRGRETHLHARPQGLAPLVDWMNFYTAFWHDRFKRLEELLKEDGPMTNPELTAQSIVIEKEFPYPPAKIWRALTEGSLIKEWLLENDFEPVVGRRFNFRTTPMPQWNGVVDCEVLMVEPNHRLSYTWNPFDGLRTMVVDADAHQNGHAPPHGALRISSGSATGPQRRQLRLATIPRPLGKDSRQHGYLMRPARAAVGFAIAPRSPGIRSRAQKADPQQVFVRNEEQTRMAVGGVRVTRHEHLPGPVPVNRRRGRSMAFFENAGIDPRFTLGPCARFFQFPGRFDEFEKLCA